MTSLFFSEHPLTAPIGSVVQYLRYSRFAPYFRLFSNIVLETVHPFSFPPFWCPQVFGGRTAPYRATHGGFTLLCFLIFPPSRDSSPPFLFSHTASTTFYLFFGPSADCACFLTSGQTTGMPFYFFRCLFFYTVKPEPSMFARAGPFRPGLMFHLNRPRK